jgi:hypothetical protein
MPWIPRKRGGTTQHLARCGPPMFPGHIAARLSACPARGGLSRFLVEEGLGLVGAEQEGEAVQVGLDVAAMFRGHERLGVSLGCPPKWHANTQNGNMCCLARAGVLASADNRPRCPRGSAGGRTGATVSDSAPKPLFSQSLVTVS